MSAGCLLGRAVAATRRSAVLAARTSRRSAVTAAHIRRRCDVVFAARRRRSTIGSGTTRRRAVSTSRILRGRRAEATTRRRTCRGREGARRRDSRRIRRSRRKTGHVIDRDGAAQATLVKPATPGKTRRRRRWIGRRRCTRRRGRGAETCRRNAYDRPSEPLWTAAEIATTHWRWWWSRRHGRSHGRHWSRRRGRGLLAHQHGPLKFRRCSSTNVEATLRTRRRRLRILCPTVRTEHADLPGAKTSRSTSEGRVAGGSLMEGGCDSQEERTRCGTIVSASGLFRRGVRERRQFDGCCAKDEGCFAARLDTGGPR